ncbi:GTPase [Methylobacter sp. BBA5.1]|uniref:GTPase n=1 Tax=Methylobacter sp. BBA5.1 TaxID=1495064 RepID=UPI000564347F|nr:GTPase [Methylobacter sp. BBA5.1]
MSKFSNWKAWSGKINNPLSNASDYIDKITKPQIDQAQEDRIQAIRERLPVPVFWLLGKTQSGKSSIIKALTGSSAAEVGNGFKPCTRTAMLFDFPDAETAFLRFLDTRGLSEQGYDASEDMKWCEQKSHLVIVVIKAMDHQQEAVISALKQVRKAHPKWPIIIAQTALHEGYPNRTMGHIQPYPYAGGRIAESVPADLRCSLLKQREDFAGMNATFVPLDFTLPEDGYAPADYGLDALWDAIEQALPLGLRGMLENHIGDINDVYWQAAHPHVIGYSISAGLAAAIPVPAASLGTVVAIQGKLFHSIAHVYGLPLTRQSIREIISAVGMGVLAGMGGRELLKLIPAYGQTVALGVSGVYTAAVTYALGKTLCFYFNRTQQGKALQADMLRGVFKEEFARGSELLRDSIKKQV